MTSANQPLNVPDPTVTHPSTRPDLTNVVFLRPSLDSSLTEVGEYTYYDNEGWRDDFLDRNVLYHFGPQRLRIGKFTAIGPGTRFIMPGGTHPMAGVSTFPFTMFGGDWTANTLEAFGALPVKGDTVIGNDVWFGRQSTVMPGVTIGDGTIVAAHSVVTKDVEPYTIVGGNPARQVRQRFSDADIALLLRIRWWDWPIETITQYAATIMAGTAEDLAAIAPHE